MPPLVRRAEARDLAGVLALYRELRPQDPELAPEAAEAAYQLLLARDDVHLLVCALDGQLVATCMLVLIPNLASGARPLALIEHVVTLSAQRGRGYARLVLQAALDLAWSQRCCKVMLLSGVQRTEVHRLYTSLGFVGDTERGFVAKPPG